VNELQAAQGETHDKLEVTLKNIDRDNAEKDADLIAANREIEALGQRVYELEEELDEHQARENDLVNDLQSADQAFESAKSHYENLVNALKDARKALQSERDEALAKVKREENGRREDREGLKRDLKEMDERHRRVLEDRDQVRRPCRLLQNQADRPSTTRTCSSSRKKR
jgi:chromosome segregation ATPase